MSSRTARSRSSRMTASTPTSCSGLSRSSTARSTSAARRRPACGCARRRSGATGGRRSRTDGAPERLRQVVGRRRQRLEVVEREPARLLGLADHARLERWNANEIAPIRLAAVARLAEEVALPLEEQRPELELLDRKLLPELSPEGHLIAFARIDAAARRDPPHVVVTAVAKQQHPVVRIDHDCTHALPDREVARTSRKLLEP